MSKLTDLEIKESIIEAASKLFAQYGYNKTTMEDIAKAVHKGKSTLYYYYKSKEDVILDLFNKEASLITQKISEAIGNNLTAYERFYTYFKVISTEGEKVANLYNMCRFELKENFIIQIKFKQIYSDNNLNLIKDILTYGIERREFLSISIEEISSVASLIDTIVLNLVILELIERQNTDWQKSLLMLGNIIIRGIK